MEEIAIEQKQANKYDKIVKENMESILPVFIKDVLNFDITGSTKIPDDIQYTKERKPDVLTMITDRNKQAFVLHLEWQSKNDNNMAYRMAEYAVMLHRKYRLPVEQFVIFMGRGVMKMRRAISHKYLQFRYHIIVLKDIDYKIFLESEIPGVKVLAILGNFGNDDTDKAIGNIFNGVYDSTSGSLERSKYFNQLRILLQLRNYNIDQKFKNMFSVSDFFKPERDFLYKNGVIVGRTEGMAKGIAKGEAKVQQKCARILKDLGHEVAFISSKLGIPEENVKKMLNTRIRKVR